MDALYDIDQFQAALKDFEVFYDKEFSGEADRRYYRDPAVKNIACVAYMEGMRRAKELLK